MKKVMPNLFTTISKTNPVETVNNIKEIITQTNNIEQRKIFSSADFWNIQHKRKTAFKRRELMQVGF